MRTREDFSTTCWAGWPIAKNVPREDANGSSGFGPRRQLREFAQGRDQAPQRPAIRKGKESRSRDPAQNRRSRPLGSDRRQRAMLGPDRRRGRRDEGSGAGCIAAPIAEVGG